jgi:hypothetical protein
VPAAQASKIAAAVGSASPGSGSGHATSLLHSIQAATAQSTQTVFYAMAAVLAVSFVVSLVWFPRGRIELPTEPDELAVAEPAPLVS